MRITSITILHYSVGLYGYIVDSIVPNIFTTGVIIPVIKKSTLDPNVVKNYHRCQHQRTKKRDRADEKA